MADELSVVGKSVKRYDAFEKAMGTAKYSSDIYLHEMLHGKILRSPHGHANIISINTTKAKALHGVEAVVTADDITDKPISFPPESRILAKDKVRREGDPVAAVVALSEEIAEEALDLIEVTYDALQGVYNAEDAIKSGAPEIYSGGNLVQAFKFEYGWGDLEEGFTKANLVMEDTYRMHNANACPVGLATTTAFWDRSDNLTVWSISQTGHQQARELAEFFEIPENKVRVITTYTYGTYGGRGEREDSFLACILARMTGKPVRLQLTRIEDMRDQHGNPSSVVELKAGVTSDGLITALHTKILWEAGAPLHIANIVMAVASSRSPLSLHYYASCLCEAKIAYTNTMARGAYRGFGCINLHWAIEQMMDQLAEELGMDPVEFQLKNKIKTGDLLCPTGPGAMFNPHIPTTKLSSTDMEQCINKTAESIGWSSKWAQYKGNRDGDEIIKRGIGTGAFIHGCSSASSSVQVRVSNTGSVDLYSGFADPGTGCKTVMAQICAEELGVHYEDVCVTSADSRYTPWEQGCFTSRTTLSCGRAVQIAAKMAKEQILEEAASELETNVEDLEIKEGRIYVKANPEEGLLLEEVTSSFEGDIMGYGSFGDQLFPTAPRNYGAHSEEIEVDTETGKIKVVNISVANECGRAVNPLLLMNNMVGGIAKGVGYTLMEGYIYDQHSGVLLNPRLIDYHPPLVLDLPEEMDTMLVEPIDPIGPFGAKGASEGIMDPTAACIGNALYNATGVRIKDAPLTPDKVLRGLGKI